jgi:predicted dehydrogenase
MRLFAGEPLWCSAKVLQNGHAITPQDAHAATENIGPIAGDDIVAEFGFANGVRATFTSQAANQGKGAPFGMDLIGARRAISIRAEMVPRILMRSEAAGSARGDSGEWRLLERDPTLNWTASERSAARANGRVVDDWLAAIAQNREPICSGEAATKALEMAMAVFAAGLARRRVELPLKDRRHPLGA